jgi:hypothetical protein
LQSRSKFGISLGLIQAVFGYGDYSTSLAYGDQASFDGGDDCLGTGVGIQLA